MVKHIKHLAVLLLVSALCLPAAFATDYSGNTALQERTNSPSAAAMTVDAVVIRPLGFVATALGSAVYVISLPFSALGGNTDEAGNRLVKEPAAYTFTRPLGQY